MIALGYAVGIRHGLRYLREALDHRRSLRLYHEQDAIQDEFLS